MNQKKINKNDILKILGEYEEKVSTFKSEIPGTRIINGIIFCMILILGSFDENEQGLIIWTFVIIIFLRILISYWISKKELPYNVEDTEKNYEFLSDFLDYFDKKNTKDTKQTIEREIQILKYSTSFLRKDKNHNILFFSTLFSIFISIGTIAFGYYAVIKTQDHYLLFVYISLIVFVLVNICAVFRNYFTFCFNNLENAKNLILLRVYEKENDLVEEYRQIFTQKIPSEEIVETIKQNNGKWIELYYGTGFDKEELNEISIDLHDEIFSLEKLHEWKAIFGKVKTWYIYHFNSKQNQEPDQVVEELKNFIDGIENAMEKRKYRKETSKWRIELVLSILAIVIAILF
ncbi:hypothetical protein NEF87_002680 [Candidatus Lokiarchaeum ossiferum]|uniref:DUF2207 domain-containing protein n=1 Tax=Candidatus Lokiarchaeum ossiferum TaxID=2951803 RepID=A0ABY6HSA4_9ARCH|nr:hypothetical protein NEF87_002680 [Candidatus Lokiarchaeum sp. B-35]